MAFHRVLHRLVPSSALLLSSMLLHLLCSSEIAQAHPDPLPDGSQNGPSPVSVIRRAAAVRPTTTTVRPTITVTAGAGTGAAARDLSVVVIIVIVVAVVLGVLLLAGGFYFWFRKRPKTTKAKPMDLPFIGRNSGSARRQPDWWQPTPEAQTIDSHDHTIVPYSQGGHGYTYGRTLDANSVGVAGTRTSVGHSLGHSPRPTDQAESDRPFQIPVLASRPPPPSISPSYHTYDEEVRMPEPTQPIPTAEQVHDPPVYTPPPIPPQTAFQPRPENSTLSYLQPQMTGTSIYSNPYETSAMTRSTSGHPGT